MLAGPEKLLIEIQFVIAYDQERKFNIINQLNAATFNDYQTSTLYSLEYLQKIFNLQKLKVIYKLNARLLFRNKLLFGLE